MSKNTVMPASGGRASVIVGYPASIADPGLNTPQITRGHGRQIDALTYVDGAVSDAQRVSATATATVSGTPAQDDILRVHFFNGKVVVEITVNGTPTAAQVAAQLATAINAKAELQGRIHAVAAAAVVTVTHAGGIGGSYTTFTTSKAVAGNLDLTLTGSGLLIGGSGPMEALRNFSFSFLSGNVRHVRQFQEGKYYIVGAALAKALVESNQPIA